jgi:hypothetical protein
MEIIRNREKERGELGESGRKQRGGVKGDGGLRVEGRRGRAIEW